MATMLTGPIDAAAANPIKNAAKKHVDLGDERHVAADR